MSSATLFIAHGSPEERSNSDFRKLVSKYKKKHTRGLIVGAFLKLAEPRIPEGIELCVRSGATEVFVVPFMFFWGRHTQQDIPKIIAEAHERYPKVRFHYAGAMADGADFLEFLGHRVRALKGET